MKKLLYFFGAAIITMAAISCDSKTHETTEAENTNASATVVDSDSVATVYYIKDINPQTLLKVYDALGVKAQGNKIGIKISTGEGGTSHQLDTALIADLVREIGGNFIECNTAYRGSRYDTESHLKIAKEHGYVDLAGVDIMDADGEVDLPVEGGKHLDKDIVGKTFPDYDFVVVLSHFKGHAMGGFGGALKNISIGIGSKNGKAYIHSAGQTANTDSIWMIKTEQDDFIESMAEAAKAIIDSKGPENMLYINVANNLSVDCDCDAHASAPCMGDLGVFASLDPVALDRACVDMVFNTTDEGKKDLIERIDSRHGAHILPYAEQIGVGTQKYKLVTIE